ncbi:MFS transporter [Streptacidiphilus cavernicola]|uniref:MFS transporter n=1 Tax=Streptacidiphilus cavernicola TaxID=3342716 RepID=A0ABV6W3V1_9ACTN
MLSSYRSLFSTPGSPAMALAGLLARFPTGMIGVGAVFMITGARGSYALAGSLSATVLVVVAAAGPQLSRLVDRHGQARVAVPAQLLASGGALAELLCLRLDAPDWTLFVGAACSGLGPNVGALSRARWAAMLDGDEAALHSAYSFETVLDELCFVLGPLAATVLATAVFSAAGFLVAVLLFLVGTLSFCAQRRTEPPVRPVTPGARGSALASPGLRVLTGVLFAMGTLFGTIEITTIGFAQAHGHKSAASLVLGCYALGSLLSGLVFGVWKPQGSLPRRLLLCLLLMSAALVPLPFADGLPLVAAVLLVAGLTTAPTMVTAMGLVRGLVPAAKLTEGFSWAITGLLLGVSAGAAAGGWAVQHLGAGAGYRLPAAAAAVALLTALSGFRALRPGGGPGAVPEPARRTEPREASGEAAHVQ